MVLTLTWMPWIKKLFSGSERVRVSSYGYRIRPYGNMWWNFPFIVYLYVSNLPNVTKYSYEYSYSIAVRIKLGTVQKMNGTVPRFMTWRVQTTEEYTCSDYCTSTSTRNSYEYEYKETPIYPMM